MTLPRGFTAFHWTKILDDVREELGEGKIVGEDVDRRLNFASARGTSLLEMGAVGDPEEFGVRLTFSSRLRFQVRFIMGRAGRLLRHPKTWEIVQTGDVGFDSAVQVWSPSQKCDALFSGRVRGSAEALLQVHELIFVELDHEVLKFVLPGLDHGVSRLVSLALKSGDLVGELIRAYKP